MCDPYAHESDAFCQCGPGHPANGTWCYICELPAEPVLDDGEVTDGT